jgi:hypothetical protein
MSLPRKHSSKNEKGKRKEIAHDCPMGANGRREMQQVGSNTAEKWVDTTVS